MKALLITAILSMSFLSCQEKCEICTREVLDDNPISAGGEYSTEVCDRKTRRELERTMSYTDVNGDIRPIRWTCE